MQSTGCLLLSSGTGTCLRHMRPRMTRSLPFLTLWTPWVYSASAWQRIVHCILQTTKLSIMNVKKQFTETMCTYIWHYFVSDCTSIDLNVTRSSHVLGIPASEIELGHLVELQVAVTAVKLTKSSYKILHRLRSICILDRVVVTVSIHITTIPIGTQSARNMLSGCTSRSYWSCTQDSSSGCTTCETQDRIQWWGRGGRTYSSRVEENSHERQQWCFNV